MSALADFYDLLLPELPGIATPMVDLHLREVARDFCTKTSAWREDLTAIDLVAEQGTYRWPHRHPVNWCASRS